MTSYRFFKMADAAAQYYFRFLLVDAGRKVKIYQQTKFRRHISIRGWDITSSILEKQTSAILEFYFRFRFLLYHRNRHAILHQTTEFHSNWTTYCRNMTSYRFFKMAAAQYYFWFRICWCHCLQQVKVYQQTEFRGHISIRGWDITTSVFKKQMSAVLELYFRFRFRLYHRNRHAILHHTAEFHSNWTPTAEIWRHINFQDGGRQPCCICFGVMADHPRSMCDCFNPAFGCQNTTNYMWTK